MVRGEVTDAAGGRITRSAGRPADPELESRVFEAALEIYAEVGWASFTLSAVSARANTGKAAIYRRWSSKEDLIVDAILSIDAEPIPDTGSIREDLIATVEAELRSYLSPVGIARLRAQVEAKVYPEVFGRAMDRHRRYRNEGGRRFVAAAVGRGELPAGVDATPLLDALIGMTMNHFLSTAQHRLPVLRRRSRDFAESAADFVLGSVTS